MWRTGVPHLAASAWLKPGAALQVRLHLGGMGAAEHQDLRTPHPTPTRLHSKLSSRRCSLALLPGECSCLLPTSDLRLLSLHPSARGRGAAWERSVDLITLLADQPGTVAAQPTAVDIQDPFEACRPAEP